MSPFPFPGEEGFFIIEVPELNFGISVRQMEHQEKTLIKFRNTVSLRYRSKETLFIAAFGVLWGLLETTLGTLLKGLRLPMTGFILVALALPLVLTGRYFTPRKGSILMMSGVAALMKLFSIGGFMLSPIWAILMEGVTAECIVSVLGTRRISYMITGSVLFVYTLLHPLIAQSILYGANIYKVYIGIIHTLLAFLGQPGDNILIFGAFIILLVAFVGGCIGFISYSLARQVDLNLQERRRHAYE